jgi:hypothetical protein
LELRPPGDRKEEHSTALVAAVELITDCRLRFHGMQTLYTDSLQAGRTLDTHWVSAAQHRLLTQFNTHRLTGCSIFIMNESESETLQSSVSKDSSIDAHMAVEAHHIIYLRRDFKHVAQW